MNEAVQAARRRLDEAECRALGRAFSDEQLAAVLAAPKTHKVHPLKRLLDGRHSASARAAQRSLDVALGHLQLQHRWVADLLAQASGPEFIDAGAALAELRAAGLLAEVLLPVRGDVEPVAKQGAKGKKTPDLRASVRGGSVHVEVTAKHMHHDAASGLREFFEGPSPALPGGGVAMREYSHGPTNPTSRDPRGADIASAFAQKKCGAQQVPDGNPALLWIDVTLDEYWLESDAVSPLQLARGRLYSPGLWHAFYGRQGESPIFESQSVYPLAGRVYVQTFAGMFHQDHGARWSGVVLCFPATTVLLENPTALHPLPALFRQSLLHLRDLRVDASRVRWSKDALELQLAADRAALDALRRGAEEE